MSWTTVKPALGKIALATAAPALALALLEGGVSLLLAGRDFAAWRDRPNDEERHARYSTELGWEHIPRSSIANMYGAGKALHTNGRGFRGRAETTDSVPAGTRRVVCTGDSFTMGFGVGDDEPFCAVLARLPGLETVNMGQGGYGLDQAYLWYLRDGTRLAHDAHIVAYVTQDFRRMQLRRFEGYGKPQLVLRGDSLAVTNLPPPRRGAGIRTWYRLQATTRDLRLSALARRLAPGVTAGGGADSLARDSVTRQVAAAIVRSLTALHRRRGSTLVLVHLPEQSDYTGNEAAAWRLLMSSVAAREGVAFVDLVAEMRLLPADSIPPLFIRGDGHYTAAGHRWVARMLRADVLRAAGPPRR